MSYKLQCVEWNPRHVKFNVFDPKGANCGQLVMEAETVFAFVQSSWRGTVFWSGLIPVEAINNPELFGARPLLTPKEATP